MSDQNDRPIPRGPIDTEPRYSGEFPTSEDQRLILRGWLEVSGVEIGDYDKRIISWAAQAWDWSTFATITSWIRRAGKAGRAEQSEGNAERTTLSEQLRARGAEQAAQDAEAGAFHAQRRADEAEANGEYVDYDEAAAVREIEREMAIEAGDDSELDRQVAEDDARNERAWEAGR